MKNSELYHKTVGILVQAYFNDTLVHNNCFACAVGNLIAANAGYKYVPCKDSAFKKLTWDKTKGKYFTESRFGAWYSLIDFDEDMPHEVSVQEILLSGYSVEQAIKIESAFENVKRGDSAEEYMFNGLMAVIDCLDQIHENTDTKVTTQTKNKFIHQPCQ